MNALDILKTEVNNEPDSICDPIALKTADRNVIKIYAPYGIQKAIIGHIRKKREEAEVSKRRDDY